MYFHLQPRSYYRHTGQSEKVELEENKLNYAESNAEQERTKNPYC